MENKLYEPFFSVIMACHNTEKYIEEAILSVLNQTIADWELIVVDDASTDSSYEIASRYSEVDGRIRVYRLDVNRGPAYARNTAVGHSSGKWLSILDADDVYFPEKLERQQACILARCGDDLVLIGTGVLQISADGKVLKAYSYPKESMRLKRNLYNSRKFPPHSSIIYEASVFKEIGGFNSRFRRSEDYDLWLRISEKGDLYSLGMPLIKYRIHSGGMSLNPSPQGYSQYMYGSAANICRRLRLVGFNDPSINDESFNRILRLIFELYRNSFFERGHCLLSQIKSITSRRDWYGIFSICIQNPLTFLHLILVRIGIVSFTRTVFKKYKETTTCME